MGYNYQLDKDLEASQAALNARSAASPVRAPSAPGLTAEHAKGARREFLSQWNSGNKAGAIGGAIRGVAGLPVAAVTEGLEKLSPVADAASRFASGLLGDASPVRDATAGTPRPAPGQAAAPGGPSRGSIEAGPPSPVEYKPPTPPSEQYRFDPEKGGGGSMVGGVHPVTQRANDIAGAKLAVMRAQEEESLDRRNAAIDAGNQKRIADFEARNAQRAADVDAFANRNRAEWIANTSGRAANQAMVQQAAQQVDPRAIAALANRGQQQPIQQSAYLQNALALNEAGTKAQQSHTQQDEAAQRLALGEQAVRRAGIDANQAQAASDVYQKLIAAADPKEKAALQERLLVLHGKVPDRYSIERSKGPPTFDAMGNPVPGEDAVYRIDKWGGDAQRVGGRQEQQFPIPNAEAISLLKKDPSKKALFEAKFGPGSAARYGA